MVQIRTKGALCCRVTRSANTKLIDSVDSNNLCLSGKSLVLGYSMFLTF